ncbi:DNA-binding protein HU-beta [Parabacteroides sp. PF5-6]|nr:DNA-binding protein HU-beta [Parabacteroides sp. PF5-6]
MKNLFSQNLTDKSFFTPNKSYIFAFQKFKDIIQLIFIDMTKADIVSEISKSTGIDKTTVLSSIESFMEIVKDSLAQGENVYLRGFGSFVVKKRAQKTARNISKNTTIIIPEHNIPSFKPAKTFLNEVK